MKKIEYVHIYLLFVFIYEKHFFSNINKLLNLERQTLNNLNFTLNLKCTRAGTREEHVGCAAKEEKNKLMRIIY